MFYYHINNVHHVHIYIVNIIGDSVINKYRYMGKTLLNLLNLNVQSSNVKNKKNTKNSISQVDVAALLHNRKVSALKIITYHL